MRFYLSFLLLAGLLAGCGNRDYQEPGGGGNPDPPPPSGPMFSVSYSPNKDTFAVAKNSSAQLTVSITISSSETKKVRLTFSDGVGLDINPRVVTITGSGTARINISSPVSMTDKKPFFTVQATGLNKDDDERGQDSFATTFQWNVP